MMTFQIEPFSDRGFELGEGPHWNADDGRLYFVDILGNLAASYDSEKKLEILFRGDLVSAILPVDSQPNKLVVSSWVSLYLVDRTTGEKSLIDQLNNPEDVRFNDAKCDPKGRLWIGTMAHETAPGVLKPEQGALYLSTNGGKLVEKFSKVTISNGLCWSLDEKWLYYIDSIPRIIYRFEYDSETGNIANGKVFVDMNKDSAFNDKELPDGMTIDRDGNLWVAMFFGGRVVHIDGQTGKLIESINLPTSLPTSVCFGGPNLDQLYITTCKKSLPEEERAKQPLAGYIFKVTSPKANFVGFKPAFNLRL